MIAGHLATFSEKFPKNPRFCSHASWNFPSIPFFSLKSRIFFIKHVLARKFLKKIFMVYILAANSVHLAKDALSSEEQSKYKDKFYSLLVLNLSFYAENPRKIVKNLLPKNLEDRTESVVWHGVLNNRFSRHKSNNYRPLSVQDLINVLKTLQAKINALV